MELYIILLEIGLLFLSLFGLSENSQTVLNLPELKVNNSIWQGGATAAFQYSNLTAITACAWIKSTSLFKTGTIFRHICGGNLSWGLIALKRDFTDPERKSNQFVRVAIDGKIGIQPVSLHLDDIVWHHVCMTWNSTGKWSLLKDGAEVESGSGLKVGAKLNCNGEILFGSALSGQQRQHNLQQAELLPYVGKITNFVLYNITLNAQTIKKMANCSNFRYTTICRNTTLQPIYKWTPHKIHTTWPATFIPTENVCNGNAPVTVECTHNHIMISVLRDYFKFVSTRESALHLNDPSCTPNALSTDRKRFTFDITDFQACGTKQTVNENEVIYSNEVTNWPSQQQVLISRVYHRVEVRCHFPINLLVSTNTFQQGHHLPHFAVHTPLNIPESKQDDIEALTLLYKDETFETILENSPTINLDDFLYVGIFVKNKTASNPVQNINIAIDSCYAISSTFKRQFFQENGCTTETNAATVLENGKSQARLQLSGRLFSYNFRRDIIHEGEIKLYLQCFLRVCRGSSCATTCSKNTGANQQRKKRALTTSRRSLQTTSLANSQRYSVTIGPLYTNWRSESNSSNVKYKALKWKTIPTTLIKFWIAVSLGFLISSLVFAFMKKKILQFCFNQTYQKHKDDESAAAQTFGEIKSKVTLLPLPI